MTIAAMLLAEFEHEAVTTRRFLERLPDDKLTWKAHPQSMSAGQLAIHMARIPGNVVRICNADQVPVPNFAQQQPLPTSTQEILDTLQASIATVREVLPTITDERMQATWRMMNGDKEVLAMPRYNALRSIMLN